MHNSLSNYNTFSTDSLNCLGKSKKFSPTRLKKNTNGNEFRSTDELNFFSLYLNSVWQYNSKYVKLFDTGYSHVFSHKMSFKFLNNVPFQDTSVFDFYTKRGSFVGADSFRKIMESMVGSELLETARLAFYGIREYRRYLLESTVDLQDDTRYMFRERMLFQLNKSYSSRFSKTIKKDIINKTLNQSFLLTNLKYTSTKITYDFEKESRFKYKRLLSDTVRLAHKNLNFPIFGFLKKTTAMFSLSMTRPARDYKSYELYRQYLRHPSTQLRTLTKYIRNSMSIENYRAGTTKVEYVDLSAQFFKVY